ncbi:hypothetical protein FHS16_005744 [Paenibacillus endophyticus]|uniref:Uncharacterized protein n=1 Tax=Paenibacillus endophyticus TaxID=1294268 RepID=A0A7W5GD74_9BACL|nr:hypothetical protein [Paenibacillus endophyticus]MBB3155636.1 hypothetical protein [Paenibacillus endophyticus]
MKDTIRPITYSLLLAVSCTKETSIDIGDAIGKTEDSFRKLDWIATTASSYDGKKDVKIRLMVAGNLTEAEATNLFRRIMDIIAEFRIIQMFWMITMVTLISRIMTMPSFMKEQS